MAVEVAEAIATLAERDELAAAVFELRYFGGFTIAETAKILGVSPTTVKTKYQFARAWLQSFLDGTIQP